MKNAMFFLDVNKKINLNDYISVYKLLLENKSKYNKIYCIITDTQHKDDSVAVNNIQENILDNIAALINMGLDNNVMFIKESQLLQIAQNANTLSNYIYLSKLTKSPYIKEEIQQQTDNNIKVSKILGMLNLISACLSVDVDDIYVSQKFVYIYEIAKKIINDFNQQNETKLTFGNLVLNTEYLDQSMGLDGNTKISNRFHNDLELLLEDEEIRLKVMSIYTDPNHIKVTDKGNVDNNPLFVFIRQICDDEIVKKHFDINTEKQLEEHYMQGGIGDAKLKNMLYEAILTKFNNLKNKIDLQYITERIDNNTAEFKKLLKIID